MSSEKEENATLNDISTPATSSISLERASPGRILPLDPDTISQIHSSKHITSLQTVVLGLLENSLDAGSTQVDIAINWRRGDCHVHDNGNGIPSTEFAETGGLGRMYCTSKRAPAGCHVESTEDSHGSTGTFLAELAAMSYLTITSMQNRDHDSSVLSLHHGKVIARVARFNDGNSTARLHGTNISVRDLFGNMPVRIKQRALARETVGSDEKAWQSIKRGIVALLLAWPTPCSVKLRDATGLRKMEHIAGYHPNVSTALTEKGLNQLRAKRAKFDLRDSMPILFQTGLAPHDSVLRWVPLSASTPAVTLKGLICLDPVASKLCQFLSIGTHPCGVDSGNNELHDAVNKVFANSSFGLVESRPESTHETGQERVRTESVGKQLQLQKSVDRHPMYCMQLAFRQRDPSSIAATGALNDSTLKALSDVLETAVTTWLDHHGFRPRKRKRRCNQEQQSPSAATRSSSRPRTARGDNPSSIANSAAHNASPSKSIDRNTSATHKRRKIIDLSTDDQRRSGTHGSLQDHEADPMLQSHMRSGRKEIGSMSSHALETFIFSSSAAFREPSTPQSATAASQTEGGKSSRKSLTARPLHTTCKIIIENEKAANSSIYQTTGRDSQSLGLSRRKSARLQDAPTSDDFGAGDDAAMVAAVEHAESFEVEGAHSSRGIPGYDDIVTWKDPTSNHIYRVNSRTGVVLPADPADENLKLTLDYRQNNRHRAGIDTALTSTGKPLSLSRRAAIALNEDTGQCQSYTDSKWLPGFLKQWNNPIFVARDEDSIPVASLDGPGIVENDDSEFCRAPRTSCHRHALRARENATITKLSRKALKRAEVIAQVDRKYILCKMPSTVADDVEALQLTSQTLLLIDQHAASERVILEDLLASFFVKPADASVSSSSHSQPYSPCAATTKLETDTTKRRSLRFEISLREYNLFIQYKQHFDLFGIYYDAIATQPGRNGYHSTKSAKQEYRLLVTHLPTAIAERCSLQPTNCIDLLRSEVWSLHDGKTNAIGNLPALKAGEPSWVTVLPLLPKKLKSMIQSRSCRSAIMFNDILTRQECQSLVRKLARCTFPFVCAHGRVSMVPLVEVPKAGEGGCGFGTGIDGITRKASIFRRPRSEGPEDLMDDREQICGANALKKWMHERSVADSSRVRDAVADLREADHSAT